MSPEQTAAFFLFSLIAAVTPGPSNALLTATGANAGVLRGLPCLFGVSAGMGSMMLLVAGGVAGVVLSHEAALPVIKLCGAGFLLWLAWRIATSGGSGPGKPARIAGFLDAAALQWVNPKAWVVSAGAAATYLDPNPGSGILQPLAFALVFVAAALPCGFLWLALGASVQGWLRSKRRRRIFNLAMGVTLAASVVAILR
jgi:threonine/homoserine/homoserine lactone efflux protein